MKKILLIFTLFLSLLLTACGNEKVSKNEEQPIELIVYSQLSSFMGEQEGWFADVLLDKFNVKLIITPDYEAVFEDIMGDKRAADIMVFGSTGEHYKQAVEEGKLLDWEADDLLAEHGAYILGNMPYALEYNRGLTPEAGKIFGFGNSVATSVQDFEDCFYTWDIRWDLYKELGYPKVNNLEDLVTLFEDMKEICPVDENGNEVYAMSIWSDWDESMAMYVKSMASAYYGYDEFHLGLYDTETGSFYGALDENGPYLEMLSFFNTLYRKGLLDPESRTQTYDDMITKMQSGGVLFSIFNYAGNLTYNTEGHIAQGKYMASLLPEEASPIVYGLSVFGGNRVWTISADSIYPELCMEILNWLCTPEGRMVSEYGPQGITWDYDEEGNTYFTELGKACYMDGTTIMTGKYAGQRFWDGTPQINNITWSSNAANPDSNGETYNAHNWKSNIPEACCDMEQDWRNYTGALTVNEYIRSKSYVVAPATYYTESEKSDELEAAWELAADCIIAGSWEAIYAKSDSEFEDIVDNMIEEAVACGYEECIKWCENEAEVRYGLEEEIRN